MATHHELDLRELIVAYDEELTRPFRKALGRKTGLSEKKMMGGICFLHHGNMIGGADRNKAGLGRFLFRVGRDNEAEALARKGSYIMEQGGRRMGGFVFVNEDDCDDKKLKAIVPIAYRFVRTLPRK